MRYNPNKVADHTRRDKLAGDRGGDAQVGMTALTEEQRVVAESITRFIQGKSRDGSSFVLHGLAGTGKTTVMAYVAKKFSNSIPCAFTGKAASVFRRKTGLDVSTVHQVIYDFAGLVQNRKDPDRKDPVFRDKRVDLSGSIVLIDECSMLGESLAKPLIATGAKVVACGDPGQLPPVMDRQYFINADVRLTEIHRQALESPIIRQAHRIRTKMDYAADGEGFVVKLRAEPEDLLAADIILCWRNKTRQRLNARKRELLSKQGPLTAGEPVMCLHNDHKLGIYNGAVYMLLCDFNPLEPQLVISDEGVVSVIPRATVEGDSPRFLRERYDQDWTPFAPAYAATVHKSQGSEYGNVLLFDECSDDDRRRFLYTGVTRAQDHCTVIRWRD